MLREKRAYIYPVAVVIVGGPGVVLVIVVVSRRGPFAFALAFGDAGIVLLFVVRFRERGGGGGGGIFGGGRGVFAAVVFGFFDFGEFAAARSRMIRPPVVVGTGSAIHRPFHVTYI